MRTWLRNMRRTMGISQKELADKLGISANHYSNIESCKRQADLNLSTVQKLSEALNISVDQISEHEKLVQKNK